MRLTRKTMVALGISGAMTVLAGVSASAAVLDLPILGFGEAANGTAAPPQVVHRTVYDDHYVTAPTTPKAQASATSGGPKSAPTTGAPASSAGAPAAAPNFSAASVPAPANAPAPAFTPSPTEPPATQPPATTVGRPPVPAGCREPEWDAEHQVWHCSNSVAGDD